MIARPRPPVLDVVVPVHNEELDLERSVRRLRSFLDEGFPFETRITIADNASTDATWSIAQRLAAELPGVTALWLPRKGRGRALREAWLQSDARVLAYMDVDMSTDLRAMLPLVAPLVSGHSELAIGSRLAWGARVERGTKREVISRVYNLLLRTVLRVRASDAQCGFKAVRADVARRLLPLIDDGAWFFDTELLVVAERSNLRIHEVPVDWVDDPDSRVHIASTAVADLRGIARLLRHQRRLAGPCVPVPARHAGRQVARFAAIGVVSTIAYIALYALLREWFSAGLSNAAALVATAVGNTAANRRVTFEVRGADGAVRAQLAGLVALGIALAITSASIGVLHALAPAASRAVEVAVLVAANAVATAIRFLVLRRSIARPLPLTIS